MKLADLWFVVNALIVTAVIILIWLIYAYTYKTSVTRLAKLAAKKYVPTAPQEIQDQYVIQCDKNLSSYNSSSGMFTAVMTFTPDMDHPSASPKSNITKIYKVISEPNSCENNVVVCAEPNQDNCLKPDYKTAVVTAASCININ
jgi:hypothetical protein